MGALLGVLVKANPVLMRRARKTLAKCWTQLDDDSSQDKFVSSARDWDRKLWRHFQREFNQIFTAWDIAELIVPASAVFSVFLGIALIGCKNKRPLLDVFETLQEGLTRLAMMVIQLAPVGIFTIAANVTGTLSFADFGRLQVYILTFIAASLLLTFWILPSLTALLTSFSFRAIVRSARPALITGFATGNLFIALPMLIEQAKRVGHFVLITLVSVGVT